MILMLICIGCVKVYLKTKKMTNISQAQAGFKANSRRNPLWISRLFNAKSSCACRNRLNFRLFRYTLGAGFAVRTAGRSDAAEPAAAVVELLNGGVQIGAGKVRPEHIHLHQL